MGKGVRDILFLLPWTWFAVSLSSLPVYNYMQGRIDVELTIVTLAFYSLCAYVLGGARGIRGWLLPARMVVARRKAPTGDVVQRLFTESSDPFGSNQLAVSENEPRPVPALNVCIMITGTHGDVAPFVALAKELRQLYGHRIRFATHMAHRAYVLSEGIDFYPLSGDPRVMSSWMVQSHGRLLPSFTNPKEFRKEMTQAIPEKTKMINDIMESTWPACTDQLSEEIAANATPFVAHAIISNPVTYGHFHCANALNIPLHMAFPQPWTPTQEYPHPFSAEFGKIPNSLTYAWFDALTWMSLNVNDWRTRVLGLDRLDVGDQGAHALNNLEVPFAYMWSPSLSPKAHDWGPHVDVVGTLLHDKDAATAYEPSSDLATFLADPQKPVFIGFGSMVIEDPDALFQTIVQAAAAANARMIVQSSWSKLGKDGTAMPPTIHLIGNCPHSWLLPQCCAVIHHGGAGTVAAGLRFGLPTFICPFFGDQHFWGDVVFKAGVGPAACPIVGLTAEKLTAALQVLRSAEVQNAAKAMAAKMEKEDGVSEMCKVFNRRLPLEDMCCQVSLFAKSEPRVVVAEKFHSQVGLRMSMESHAAIQDSTCATRWFWDFAYVHWDPASPASGLDGLRSIPYNFCNYLFNLFKILLEPFREAALVVDEWRQFGGRPNYLNVAVTVIVALVVGVVALPPRICVESWNALRKLCSRLARIRRLFPIRSTLVYTSVRHPLLRPTVKIGDVPTVRQSDLVEAAVMAEHVLACVAFAQGRRVGDIEPFLTPSKLKMAACILQDMPPPRSRRKQKVYATFFTRWCRWFICLKYWWRGVSAAPCYEDLDLNFEKGMFVTNFCLRYGAWRNEKDQSVFARVTAPPAYV